MSRDWRWPIVAFALYAAFLFVYAPVSLPASALSYWTHGAVRLEHPRGSAWHGNAAAVSIVDRSGRTYRFERLEWQWLASRLMTGEFVLQIVIDDPKVRGSGRITIGPDGVRAREATFRMPVSAFEPYVPLFSRARLSGEIMLHSKEFTFDGGASKGVVTVQLRNAANAQSSAPPLGEYRALVAGAGRGIEFQIETVNGALHVQGRGTWASGEGLAFDGIAESSQERRADLEELLSQAGSNQGGGKYRLKFRGFPLNGSALPGGSPTPGRWER